MMEKLPYTLLEAVLGGSVGLGSLFQSNGLKLALIHSDHFTYELINLY